MRCLTTHTELKSQVCEGLAAPMEALGEMAYQMFLPQFTPNEGDDLRRSSPTHEKVLEYTLLRNIKWPENDP